MTRNEGVGLAVAAIGHVALVAILSVVWLAKPVPLPTPKPIEVSLVDAVALDQQAPPAPAPPARGRRGRGWRLLIQRDSIDQRHFDRLGSRQRHRLGQPDDRKDRDQSDMADRGHGKSDTLVTCHLPPCSTVTSATRLSPARLSSPITRITRP